VALFNMKFKDYSQVQFVLPVTKYKSLYNITCSSTKISFILCSHLAENWFNTRHGL